MEVGLFFLLDFGLVNGLNGVGCAVFVSRCPRFFRHDGKCPPLTAIPNFPHNVTETKTCWVRYSDDVILMMYGCYLNFSEEFFW